MHILKRKEIIQLWEERKSRKNRVSCVHIWERCQENEFTAMMWIFIVGFSQQTAQNLIDISINCLVFAFVRFLNVVKERKKLPTHDEINKKKTTKKKLFLSFVFRQVCLFHTNTHARGAASVNVARSSSTSFCEINRIDRKSNILCRMSNKLYKNKF